jgi:hypothetical protein
MMRLARIVRDAIELDGSMRSLPIPCKNDQAPSNASQIVRVLLKSNASGVFVTLGSPSTDFVTRPLPGQDWTDSERAEIRRLEKVCDASEHWTLECSQTDIGDPWCVV